MLRLSFLLIPLGHPLPWLYVTESPQYMTLFAHLSTMTENLCAVVVKLFVIA